MIVKIFVSYSRRKVVIAPSLALDKRSGDSVAYQYRKKGSDPFECKICVWCLHYKERVSEHPVFLCSIV